MVLRWMVGGSFVFLLWLGFHANLPVLNSTWPGPVGETDTSAGRTFFSGQRRVIHTIARTGAMLSIGQERSRENAALAAGPRYTRIGSGAAIETSGDLRLVVTPA